MTVFRDGRYAVTRNVADITKKKLIRCMIGRELTEKFPARQAQIGEPVLELKAPTGNGDTWEVGLLEHRDSMPGCLTLKISPLRQGPRQGLRQRRIQKRPDHPPDFFAVYMPELEACQEAIQQRSDNDCCRMMELGRRGLR